MKEALIIGDVAGEFDALLRLVNRVDSKVPIIGVGDLCDRGPHSASVIDWFMSNPRADAVKGNHEDMMIDYALHHARKIPGKYDRGVWLMNGGDKTLRSYEDFNDGIPHSHIDWLSYRPLYKFTDDRLCIVTHAPIHARHSMLEAMVFNPDSMTADFEDSVLWNRTPPRKRDFFQVFGHNSHWGMRPFGDENAWGICIDQSRKQILTGFHWPTGEIFEEPYEIVKTLPRKSADL